tara:strand:+ start:20 stop:328 length:309 start_codon:yes stop_codon:yes gene_type:complete
MPTYRFKDHNTGDVWEEIMMIAEMEKFKKKKHIELLPPTQMNIVSGVGTIDGKTDSGWKDNLQRIAAAHPESALAERYGSGESSAKLKAKQVIKKHRARKKI